MQKVKNTVPVYDIGSLSGAGHLHGDIIAEPFAEYLKVHPNLHHPHRHSFYHMVLFTKGGGTHTIDFERFPVQMGEMYFMVPGQVHSWEFEGAINGYVVNFSEELFRAFLADPNYLEKFTFWGGIAKDGIVVLPRKTMNEASRLLQLLVAETRTAAPFALDQIRGYLLELFILIARAIGGKADKDEIAKPGCMVLHQFRKLVNQYYHRYKLPKEYAALLYITPNHLNGLCQDLLGQSAGEVIRGRLLLEAKRMLVNADLSISEIAYQLGFTDNSYFTKFFKKYTGTTPEAFKNELKGPRP